MIKWTYHLSPYLIFITIVIEWTYHLTFYYMVIFDFYHYCDKIDLSFDLLLNGDI